MVCCFFGHRDSPSGLVPQITSVLEQLIESGERIFLVGNQGSFDRMVLRSLRDMKIVYPEILYYVVLPYLPTGDEDTYYRNDETLFPEGLEFVHPHYAIAWRNDYLVRQADVLVTYVTHSWGGAARYAQKAEKQGKRIINLAT